MAELLRRLGLAGKLGQPGGPQYVHVAGTNGKGSTVRYVECAILSQGHRVGATYSPYVHQVTERVHLDGRPTQRGDLARWLDRALDVGDGMAGTEWGPPSEFETKTAAGFLAWAEAGCDWVALEVGMGGRLDATNVVDPACAVVVSIGLDHTEHLGGTLAAIAAEKAAIVKPGRPAVAGLLPPEALAVVEARAAEVGAPLWRMGRELAVEECADGYTLGWPGGLAGPFRPGMEGLAMPHNAGLALAACLAAEAIADVPAACEAVGSARLPGRMERRRGMGCEWVLDGAHNGEAARALAGSLPAGIPAVVGMLEGHDASAFGRALAGVAGPSFAVPVDWHRSRDPRELAAELLAAGWEAEPCATLREGMAAAAALGGTALVTGSFYLVGEAGRLLDPEA